VSPTHLELHPKRDNERRGGGLIKDFNRIPRVGPGKGEGWKARHWGRAVLAC